jgi:hypothetical protein
MLKPPNQFVDVGGVALAGQPPISCNMNTWDGRLFGTLRDLHKEIRLWVSALEMKMFGDGSGRQRAARGNSGRERLVSTKYSVGHSVVPFP